MSRGIDDTRGPVTPKLVLGRHQFCRQCHGEIAGTGIYGGVEQAFVLLRDKFPQMLPGQTPGLCSPGNQQR